MVFKRRDNVKLGFEIGVGGFCEGFGGLEG